MKKRDGFTLVCLNKERTGLTMDIYLDCIGNGNKPIVWVAKECRHKGRKEFFPVTISDKPRVKKWFFRRKKKMKEWQDIFSFIAKNRAILITHWNHELDDLDALTYLVS